MQQGKAKQPKAKTRKPAISNQVKLDANNPIPFDFSGNTFSVVNNTSFLPFLLPNDNYAPMLLEARLLSTTNNACITTKKDYCAGEGFMPSDNSEFTEEQVTWFSSMNLRNQNITTINQKIFEDFFTWGNIPIEVVRFTVLGKKKLFVYPHSLLEWRLCKPDDNDIVTHAVQSKLFIRQGIVTQRDVKNGKKLPIYNPMRTDKQNWQKDADDKSVERTLFWYKNEVTGFPHYGLPSNVASMIYQILEYKSARYNLDNLDNNLVVASILALKGNLTQDEANRLAKIIISQHTGDGKRGRTAVLASEQGIDESSLHKLDTKTDGSFTEADAKWSEKIILANQWDAILAGILSPSTLGKGSGFLAKILEIKLNTVIKPEQRKLMAGVWDHILKIADDWMNLGFSKYKKIEFKNSVDISGLTDVDITPAVQVNEVRKAKGLQEDPNQDGVYMKPVAATPTGGGGGDAGESLGKIPLAIQQLSLAAARAKEVGDDQLSERLQKKIDELLLLI